MKNLDRALAYAKQRGVDIPNREYLEGLTVDRLKHQLENMHIVPRGKAKKGELVDAMMIALLIHSGGLTPAQIKRLHQKHDDRRTLRDRNATKIQRKISRRRWLFT